MFGIGEFDLVAFGHLAFDEDHLVDFLRSSPHVLFIEDHERVLLAMAHVALAVQNFECLPFKYFVVVHGIGSSAYRGRG